MRIVNENCHASRPTGARNQCIQAGRHLAGQIVNVRIEPTVLHVLLDRELIKTVPRRSDKEVRQLRAHKVHSYPQKTG
jgi:hypothetical protein